MLNNTNTLIFFDTEFTGLHQKTTLLSIGLVSECGSTFYAEFTDYDKSQIDQWLQENVLDNFTLDRLGGLDDTDLDHLKFKGTIPDFKVDLEKWLSRFKSVEIWSDCLSYDWFCLMKYLNMLLTYLRMYITYHLIYVHYLN